MGHAPEQRREVGLGHRDGRLARCSAQQVKRRGGRDHAPGTADGAVSMDREAVASPNTPPPPNSGGRPAPTSSSSPARRRSCGWTATSHRWPVRRRAAELTGALARELGAAARLDGLRGGHRGGLLVLLAGTGPGARQRLPPARRRGPGTAGDPRRSRLRRAATAGECARLAALRPGSRALVTGPTGSGKSTTPRRAGRLDQHAPGAARHHHRGPVEYVHEHKRSVREPARGGDGHGPSRRRCAALCARTRTSCWSASCATWSRSASR